MKIAMTGASGFLGHHLAHKLIADGHELSVICRASSDLSELGELKYKKVFASLSDVDALKKVLLGQDQVFHLAGLVSYKKSDRAALVETNVFAVQNIVDAISAVGAGRLLHVSSVVAVGAGFQPQQILNEDSPFNLSHLNLGYFETKHQGEEIVRSAARLGKIDAVIVNPSTIYGPGDAKKGSRKAQLQAARGQLKFYPPGGVNIISVDDAVTGILQAIQKGRKGERYILAGENLLLKDVFAIISELAGSQPPKICLSAAVLKTLGHCGDLLSAVTGKKYFSIENAWAAILYHWFSAEKARAELGFQAGPARAAIGQSIQWIQQHPMLGTE